MLLTFYAKRKQRLTVIVGAAGEGKTTLARRLEKLSLNNGRKAFLCYFKDYSQNESLSVTQMLCGSIDKTKREEVMEWINQNTSQCDVIMDGFDQLPYKLANVTSVRPPISDTEKYSSAKLLALIITGAVLRGANIYVLSRPHAVANLPPDARPESVVQIKQFRSEDVEALMIHYFENENEVNEILYNLKALNRSLFQLIHVPIYFQLFTSLSSENITACCSTTKFLELGLPDLYRSNHVNLTKGMTAKLAKLAFDKLLAGEGVITDSDLIKNNLDNEAVMGLMLSSVAVSGSTQWANLIEGDVNYVFSHQLFQVS